MLLHIKPFGLHISPGKGNLGKKDYVFGDWHCSIVDKDAPAMLASPTINHLYPSCPPLTQVPANGRGRAVENGITVWTLNTHMGNPDETPDSRLRPGPALALRSITTAAICGVN